MPRRPSLSDYSAVCFDIDGTLVDSMEMIVLGLGDAIEAHAGLRPEDHEIRRLIGMPLTAQMSLYAGSEEQVPAMIADAIERMEGYSHKERLFDAAIETLRLCHRNGQKTALVTSKNAQELAPFLNRFPGMDAVDTAVCSSDVVHPKPDPERALLACRRLGVDPSEGLFIGDSVYDMKCARRAGMACVAVAYGAAARENLIAEDPDILFDTPEELLQWAQNAFLVTSCPEKS